MFHKRLFAGLLLGTTLGGCVFDEGLTIENIDGTVVIPADLVDRDYQIDGSVQTLNDPRNIGPVFLGLYSGILEAERVAEFPHPEVGPTFAGGRIGDAFPYGGTSIGAFRPLCLEALRCKVVSGRFVDWDGMAYWFGEVLGEPIVDYFGDPAESGEFIRQTCMEAFNHTTDQELGLTVFEDRNGDEALDEKDLDFVLREDGNYEAAFTLWQQEYFEDSRGEVEGPREGMTLWGYMDAPAAGSGEFTSCIVGGSFTRTIDYNQNFRGGTNARDLLNRPSAYIQAGDLVAGDQGDGTYGWKFTDVQDNPELWLNFEVQ